MNDSAYIFTPLLFSAGTTDVFLEHRFSLLFCSTVAHSRSQLFLLLHFTLNLFRINYSPPPLTQASINPTPHSHSLPPSHLFRKSLYNISQPHQSSLTNEQRLSFPSLSSNIKCAASLAAFIPGFVIFSQLTYLLACLSTEISLLYLLFLRLILHHDAQRGAGWLYTTSRERLFFGLRIRIPSFTESLTRTPGLAPRLPPTPKGSCESKWLDLTRFFSNKIV